MAYRLQITAGDHQATVASFLETCREQGPDLTLVPEDGLSVTTHSLTLSLYSPFMRSLLASLPPSSSLSLSVPAPSSSVTLLMKLLSEGLVMGKNRQELEQVQEVAKVLGIILGKCKVGSRRQGLEKKNQVEGEEQVDYEEEMDEEEQVYGDKQLDDKGQVKQHEPDKNEEDVNESQGTSVNSCTECGKQFKHEGHFKRHKINHTKNFDNSVQPGESFICSNCPDTFRNSKKLAKHLIKEHGINRVLSKSKENVKSGIRLPCTECEKTFTRADKLSKHIKDKHQKLNIPKKEINISESYLIEPFVSEKLYQCKNCEKTFRNDKQRYKHNASIHSGVAIICEDCDKNFSRRDKLNVHRRKKHSMKTELFQF